MSELTAEPSREGQPDTPAGNLISITAIRLEDPARRQEFMGQVSSVMKQLKQTPGLVARRIDVDPEDPALFYTVTAWQDEDSMRRFRDSGSHAEAKDSANTPGQTLSANWVSDEIPTTEKIKKWLHRIELPGPDGVVLKELAPWDAQAYFDLVDFDRAHLSQHDDHTAEKYPTVEAVRKSIENGRDDRLRFGIWAGEQMVGTINLDSIEDATRPEVGYWIGAEHIGHGYAAKALETLIPYAFSDPAVKRLFAQVYKDNVPSIRTLEKCGFNLSDDDLSWQEFELARPAVTG